MMLEVRELIRGMTRGSGHAAQTPREQGSLDRPPRWPARRRVVLNLARVRVVQALERAVYLNSPCAAEAALSPRLCAPELAFPVRSGVAWYSAVCIGFQVAALLATEDLPFEARENAAKVELGILAGPNVRVEAETTA